MKAKPNTLHPNPYINRVYPTKEQLAVMQELDRRAANCPYERYRFTRPLAVWVLNILRRFDGYRSFVLRLRFIEWYYGPQDMQYIAVFPGYQYGFYDSLSKI